MLVTGLHTKNPFFELTILRFVKSFFKIKSPIAISVNSQFNISFSVSLFGHNPKKMWLLLGLSWFALLHTTCTWKASCLGHAVPMQSKPRTWNVSRCSGDDISDEFVRLRSPIGSCACPFVWPIALTPEAMMKTPSSSNRRQPRHGVKRCSASTSRHVAQCKTATSPSSKRGGSGERTMYGATLACEAKSVGRRGAAHRSSEVACPSVERVLDVMADPRRAV